MNLIRAYDDEFFVPDIYNWVAIDDDGCVACFITRPKYGERKEFNWDIMTITDNGVCYAKELHKVESGGKHTLIKITKNIIIGHFDNLENL
jgi:hypothetical protein